jgi:hypothetical protein
LAVSGDEHLYLIASGQQDIIARQKSNENAAVVLGQANHPVLALEGTTVAGRSFDRGKRDAVIG